MSIKVDARTGKVKVQLRPLHPPNQDHGQRARAALEDERKFGAGEEALRGLRPTTARPAGMSSG